MNQSLLLKKAKLIKLLILDVDGILTKGDITYSDKGDEIKTFHVRDGFGIELLQKSGVLVGIITGRSSPIVTKRALELKIKFVYQNQANKLEAFEALKKELTLSDETIAYMGDDFMDIPVIKRAGLGITVPEAPIDVREAADWITHTSAGFGAVREVCEYLIKAQDHWEKICERYEISLKQPY